QRLAVRGESERRDRPYVSRGQRHYPSRGRIPHADGAILEVEIPRRHEHLAIRRDGVWEGALDALALEDPPLFVRDSAPELQRQLSSDRQTATVRSEDIRDRLSR